ncbi:MAG TPA: hypothetical protein VGJ94_14970 [Syntrophorhabdaceae bacterium]|jgi:hypothetical protein
MTKLITTLIVAWTLLAASPFSFAQTAHSEEENQGMMKMPSIDVFSDDIQATFMVMANSSHEKMLKTMKMKEKLEPGSTHNIMILVKEEATGREIRNLPVTIKVTDPDDNEQVKTGSFKEMMRTYDAYFNMSKKGKYQIRIIFEAKGQKRSVGISHEVG